LYLYKNYERYFGIRISSILMRIILPLKFLLKSVSQSWFFHLGVEIRFRNCNLYSGDGKFIRFYNLISAGHSEMVAPNFLVAAATCVILLCFINEIFKLYSNNYIQIVKYILATYFFIFIFICFLLFMSFNISKLLFFRLGFEIRF